MFNLFRKPVFGIDISDYSMEIISLKGSLEHPRLLAMGRSILEPGVVEDGKILNKEVLKKSLSHLIKTPKFGKIKSNKFIFALPESKTFILIFEIPKDLKKKEQLEFLKTKIADNLPFKIEELYFDFQIQKNNNSREILLVAAQKNIIDDYLEVFKNLKLQPLAVEPESLSLGRSLIEEVNQITLIADIGARTTNLSIFAPLETKFLTGFEKNELHFSSTLEIAGNKFTEVLAENLKIPFEEAENLKKKGGGKIFAILKEELQPIISEVKNIEKYFQKKENKEIERIILAGGTAVLPNLSDYLEKELGKPVIIGDPWLKINIDILKRKEYFKEALEINPILYATCIGSALRGLSPNPKKAGINLLKIPD